MSSLLIVGATALIFDEVVARRQLKDRAVAVAAQALIIYGQGRQAYQAVMASDDSSAPDELQNLASNLLTAAPTLFNDPDARTFLLQADKLMNALVAAVAAPGSPQDPATKDRLTDLMSQLQQAFAPLLARFPAEYQSRIQAMG